MKDVWRPINYVDREFTERSRLPFPVDSRISPQAKALGKVQDRILSLKLKVPREIGINSRRWRFISRSQGDWEARNHDLGSTLVRNPNSDPVFTPQELLGVVTNFTLSFDGIPQGIANSEEDALLLESQGRTELYFSNDGAYAAAYVFPEEMPLDTAAPQPFLVCDGETYIRTEMTLSRLARAREALSSLEYALTLVVDNLPTPPSLRGKVFR